ncbi:hypothetical protein [Chitiniphilus eburneus]
MLSRCPNCRAAFFLASAKSWI